MTKLEYWMAWHSTQLKASNIDAVLYLGTVPIWLSSAKVCYCVWCLVLSRVQYKYILNIKNFNFSNHDLVSL